MNSILKFEELKNESKKPGKNFECEDTQVYAQKPRLKIPLKNSISARLD